jgi:Ni,Fe-hydrogenase maturation factor
MKVYIFGNQDIDIDNKPLLFLKQLKLDFSLIDFVVVKPNEDINFENESNVLIVDTVAGIDKPELLDESAVDKLSVSRGSSAHDYDLAFQLKYLKKLGKINKINILGIPQTVDCSYDSFHSIFKKFVAQDIQGS